MRVLLVLAVLALLGCSSSKQDSKGDRQEASGQRGKQQVGAKTDVPGRSANVNSYQVRGVFKGMDGELAVVHHEEIPNFVNREGEVSGMMSMQMSFRVGKDVDVSALTPEDKVSIGFVVEWGEAPPILITSVKSLAADTELEL